MIKGNIVNNTGKSKHIFKRTVYPGQRISLDDVYAVVSSKLPKEQSFVDWLKEALPEGWELQLADDYSEPLDVSKIKPVRKARNGELGAQGQEVDILSGSDADPSLEFASPKVIDKLSARDIFNLRIQDNPKKVIKQVTSVHKLRRALTLCRSDSRKSMLSNIIRHRIKEIQG